MVQINYMIDVEFVMNSIPEEIRDGLKVIVYHGLRLTPDQLLVTCFCGIEGTRDDEDIHPSIH